MAMKRLKFQFITTANVEIMGTCTVDVEDPTDVSEIAKKLVSRDFSTYLQKNVNNVNDNWQFIPMRDDA